MNLVVLIPDRLETDTAIERSVFGDEIELLTPNVTHSKDVPCDIWERADALLAWHELSYDVKIIEKLLKCKVIVRVGAGIDNVDLQAAKERGIVVCNVPDYGTNDVADHALALLLHLARAIQPYEQSIRIGEWSWKPGEMLTRLTGKKFGIIGLGRIGMAVALRAKAFGMEVCFYDPYVRSGYEKSLNITRVESLYELSSLSDIVSIHTPLTPETNNMLDDKYFKVAKPGQIVINTARGPIVNIEDLYLAMKNDAIYGFGSDVLPLEPPSKNEPLIKAWLAEEEWVYGRLVLTPHCAFYNKESFKEMRQKAAAEALRVLAGKEPLNRVV